MKVKTSIAIGALALFTVMGLDAHAAPGDPIDKADVAMLRGTWNVENDG